MNDIDNVEYSILAILTQADTPLWKNKVHEQLRDHDGVPRGDVSLQTVGRRIDTLMENGYVESGIVSPDDIKRDLIIAFKPTEKGVSALTKKRRELVKEIVRTNLFPEDRQTDVPREPLISTIQNRFDVEQSLAEYGTEQLVAVLARYYADQAADDLLDEQEHRLLDQISEPSQSQPHASG